MADFLRRLRRLLSDEPLPVDFGRTDADDVRVSFDLSYQRQLSRLADVRRLLAEVAAARRRLEHQIRRLSAERDQLTIQVQQAVAREDGARVHAALARKQQLGTDLAGLEEHQQALQAEADAIERTIDSLQVRADHFRARREALRADAQSTQAGTRAQELIREAHLELDALRQELGVQADSLPVRFEQPPAAGAAPAGSDLR